MPVANLLPSHSQESCSSRTGESIFQAEKQGKKEGNSSSSRALGKRIFVASTGAAWPYWATVAGLARPQSLLGAAVGGTSVLAGF